MRSCSPKWCQKKFYLFLTEIGGDLENDSSVASLAFLKREFLGFDPAKKNRNKIIVSFFKDRILFLSTWEKFDSWESKCWEEGKQAASSFLCQQSWHIVIVHNSIMPTLAPKWCLLHKYSRKKERKKYVFPLHLRHLPGPTLALSLIPHWPRLSQWPSLAAREAGKFSI